MSNAVLLVLVKRSIRNGRGGFIKLWKIKLIHKKNTETEGFDSDGNTIRSYLKCNAQKRVYEVQVYQFHVH